ncbi:MAG TPA: DNA primase [Hyphomicrobiaceae bacterium]|nr:DNA primase [Hyphomicrobiaceae bacterium]
MRFSPDFLDEIRSRLPVSQVVARKVALKKAGREFKGLSPFKVEKTPSFTVNDQKGFYHCFASGEHGDIFTFVMKTEGLSFPEAVERLAGEAGVPMPKAEPRNAELRDERARLYGLLEAAAAFFEESLTLPAAAEARRYLERRGLKRETVARFRIGYAPDGRSALKERLARAGYTAEEMARAGMLVAGDDVAIPYDRFRSRIIFPINDLKGRVIAFGGRALDPKSPAKYLNSPETPLFRKGSVLFNAASARRAAHDAGRLIVVEGYMDVVSLVEAGFEETVAPLGTALTEEQVQLLWRMAPEPILCFDGDSAGRKAAHRAIDTVLGLLKPGRSLSFVFLEHGFDPDDMVRQHGPAAFRTLLEQRRRALFDVLLEREEMAGPSAATPEQRAAFAARLEACVARIADAAVRRQYQQELRATLWARNRIAIQALTAPGERRIREIASIRRNNSRPDWRVRERLRLSATRTGAFMPHTVPSEELARRSALVPPREALLMRALVNHPWLVERYAEEVAALELTSPPMQRLRDALLMCAGAEKSLDSAALHSQLERSGLHKVLDLIERANTHRSDRFAEPNADPAEVEAGWRHTLALHNRQTGLSRALKAAERAWHEEGSEEALARIREIQRQMASPNDVEFPTEP